MGYFFLSSCRWVKAQENICNLQTFLCQLKCKWLRVCTCLSPGCFVLEQYVQHMICLWKKLSAPVVFSSLSKTSLYTFSVEMLFSLMLLLGQIKVRYHKTREVEDLCGIGVSEKQIARKMVGFDWFLVQFISLTKTSVIFSFYRLFKESFRRVCRL